jgi:energy-coupling factor transport system permease protein
LFTPAGRVLVTVPFYFFYLSITDAGLIMGVLYAARFLTVFLISALFVASTEPAALVYALMRRGLPYRYGFLLVLMLRFVPVFERERKMVSDAQKMRGLEIDKRGVRSMYRSLRYTVVPLIVSALQKTESLVMSMEGRAFGYRPDRTFTFEDHFGARDLVVTAVSWAVFALALVGRFSGWRLLNGATF